MMNNRALLVFCVLCTCVLLSCTQEEKTVPSETHGQLETFLETISRTKKSCDDTVGIEVVRLHHLQSRQEYLMESTAKQLLSYLDATNQSIPCFNLIGVLLAGPYRMIAFSPGEITHEAWFVYDTSKILTASDATLRMLVGHEIAHLIIGRDEKNQVHTKSWLAMCEQLIAYSRSSGLLVDDCGM